MASIAVKPLAKRVLFSVGAFAAAAYAVKQNVNASADGVHPQHLPWGFNGFGNSFDAAALRRGFEVYRQICSTCHSMEHLCYRNLVGVTHTEDQAKAIAKSVEIKDGPDSEGNYFMRKGRLADKFWSPYENEEQARSANNGAKPPEFTSIVEARENGADYIFHLLTGYTDAPTGVVLRDGQYYNPYFAGGALAMRPPLMDGQIEYEDGTPATVSQMAKDVVTFLNWTANPEFDQRKLFMVKWVPSVALLYAVAWYHKRFTWSLIYNRRISYTF